jgi:hypothetical protein
VLATLPLVTSVTISVAKERDLRALEGSSLLSRIRDLTISHYSGVRVQSFEARGELPELCVVRCSSIALGPEDTAVLFRAPKLAHIEIANCRLNKGALESLAVVRSAIRTFDMPAQQAGPRLGELLGAEPFHALAKLRIPGNSIGSPGFAALLPALSNIEELDVRGNKLATKDVSKLFEVASRIHALWISDNALGDSVAKNLGVWKHADMLRKLHFGTVELTDTGVLALAKSKRLGNLKSLVMPGITVKRTTTDALLASPALARARIYAGRQLLGRKKFEQARVNAAKAPVKQPVAPKPGHERWNWRQ